MVRVLAAASPGYGGAVPAAPAGDHFAITAISVDH
jgi:hypothetical protein